MTDFYNNLLASENRTRKLISMSREAGDYSKYGDRAAKDRKDRQFMYAFLIAFAAIVVTAWITK
jgi:hypothetical protein